MIEPQSAVLVVTIPAHPPGVNHSYIRSQNHVALTTAARDWIDLAIVLTRTAVSAYRWTDGRAGEFEMHIWHNDRRKDVDAPIKITLDAVCRGLGINDKRVAKLTVERVEFEGPVIRVEVKTYDR